jgi:sphinganine-1-phosphate aldolase
MRLVIRLPFLRTKIETEMMKARADIQRALIPQGLNVTRRLALPTQSKSLDWILNEMDKMEKVAPSHVNYKEGKLSGAVYRSSLF